MKKSLAKKANKVIEGGLGFIFWETMNGILLSRSVDPAEVAQITKQHRFGTIVCFAVFAISFVSVGLSVGLCLCMSVFIGFKGWSLSH